MKFAKPPTVPKARRQAGAVGTRQAQSLIRDDGYDAGARHTSFRDSPCFTPDFS